MSDNNEKFQIINKEKISSATMKGMEKVSHGLVKGFDKSSKVITSASKELVKAKEIIVKKGKDTQLAVMSYVDKKKNSRFLKSKLAAFKDGVIAGKTETVDLLKKYYSYCLASTALSFYFARCDGDIDEKEMLEIQFDLDSIIKNKDLPEALRNELALISKNEELTFDEVKKYLDGVGIDTLKEFQKDIDEIIFADGVVLDTEKEARKLFDEYLTSRIGNEHE